MGHHEVEQLIVGPFRIGEAKLRVRRCLLLCRKSALADIPMAATNSLLSSWLGGCSKYSTSTGSSRSAGSSPIYFGTFRSWVVRGRDRHSLAGELDGEALHVEIDQFKVRKLEMLTPGRSSGPGRLAFVGGFFANAELTPHLGKFDGELYQHGGGRTGRHGDGAPLPQARKVRSDT